MIHIKNPLYYRKFRHVQAYSRPIQTYSAMAYLEPSVILVYSEPCHIQNPRIFRTQDIFRTLSRNTLTYPELCVTPAIWETCHIQNFVIFRILAHLGLEAYSESYLYRYIQAYSGILNNDSYNNINFLIFTSFLWRNLNKYDKLCIFP